MDQGQGGAAPISTAKPRLWSPLWASPRLRPWPSGSGTSLPAARSTPSRGGMRPLPREAFFARRCGLYCRRHRPGELQTGPHRTGPGPGDTRDLRPGHREQAGPLPAAGLRPLPNQGCPLARVVRKELRKRDILHHKVVWSPEMARTPALPAGEAPPPRPPEHSRQRHVGSRRRRPPAGRRGGPGPHRRREGRRMTKPLPPVDGLGPGAPDHGPGRADILHRPL